MLPENEKITAVAHLVDSSVLHIKERYRAGKLIKYSYHHMKSNKFIRWDNVPHYHNIRTYPCHKHENNLVVESKKMDIRSVLEELNM